MIIASQSQAAFVPRSLPKVQTSSQEDQTQAPKDGFLSSDTKNTLAFVGVAATTAAVGYGGSLAHNIPYMGPAISGVVGAVVGASAGASLAAALPGERIKTGALLGMVGGAILGSSAGGSTAANVAMGVAGATVPYGLLMAVFSSAS